MKEETTAEIEKLFHMHFGRIYDQHEKKIDPAEIVKWFDQQAASLRIEIQDLKRKAGEISFDWFKVTQENNLIKQQAQTLADALESVQRLKPLLTYPKDIPKEHYGEAQAVDQMFQKIEAALTSYKEATKGNSPNSYPPKCHICGSKDFSETGRCGTCNDIMNGMKLIMNPKKDFDKGFDILKGAWQKIQENKEATTKQP